MLTLWYYTREIPVIPWYGYTVCRGVPNTNTVPVPVVPVTRSPQVFPYPCRTLVRTSQMELMGSEVRRWFQMIFSRLSIR